MCVLIETKLYLKTSSLSYGTSTGMQAIFVIQCSQLRVASSHWTDPVSHRLVTILVIENIWEIVVVDKQRLALGGFRELNQRLRRLRHPAARTDQYAMRIFSSKSRVFSADFADFYLLKIAHFLEFCSWF